MSTISMAPVSLSFHGSVMLHTKSRDLTFSSRELVKIEESRTTTAGTMSIPQLVKKTIPHMNDSHMKMRVIVPLRTGGSCCSSVGEGSSSISVDTNMAGKAMIG